MNVIKKYEFGTQNELLDKVDELIRENLDAVKHSNLAYTTSRVQDKYILQVLILKD